MMGHEKAEESPRELMANTLEQIEARYRQIVENASDIILRADEGGYFTFVNPAALRLTGYSENEILGKQYTELVRQDHREMAMKFYGRQYVKKIPTTYYELPLVAKNGLTVWLGQNTQLIMDGETVVGFQSIARDITNRKLAQDTLRESEGRLQSLVEHIPQRIFIKDRNSVYLYCNKQYASDHGITPDQIKGKDDFEFYTPEMALAYRADDCACMATGTVKKTEKPYQCNGQELWIHTIKVPYRDGQGQIIGVLGLFEDITDRKRMELTLRDSESHLRSLAETIPDALVVYDDLGRVTFSNRAFQELYGWSNEELVGKTITNFVPPSENEITRYNWERTLRDEKAVFETQRWTKDGKVLDMQISTSTLRNIDGKHTASIVVHHDITARKREHEKLQNNEYMLKTILATSPVGIGLVLDRKLKWVNDACLKMFGFEDQEEIAGQSTRICYPSDEEYERAGVELYTDMQSVKISEIVTSFRRKDGSIFDARTRIRSVDPSSSENLMIFVITDISDQLRAEQEKQDLITQLFQSQKLEALGTLVGGIAHDFNNMLQIILGYSDLLLSDKTKSEPCRNELRTIIETAKGGADLVTKLLAFGQQAPIFPVNMDLNHQIRQLSTLLSRTLSQVVSIDVDLCDGPTTIHADPNHIDQMLMNLAINASEAMPDGGRLKISTRNVSFNDEYCGSCNGVKRGSYVMLSVTDTGRGMDKDTLSRIFEPFFSTKQRGTARGTGLGLSVVKGIVQQLGGHIDCESEPGKGTEFRIYFPAIEAPLADVKRGAPAVQSGGTETILVVEDSIPVAELEERFLTGAGYNVIVATNGREALDIYRSRREEISLVVLDLLMPEMSGRDCLMELVKIDPSVKVIIASGYAPEDELHREIRPLVKGFLQKPFGVAELLNETRSAMDIKR